jgi:hypothetical protein
MPEGESNYPVTRNEITDSVKLESSVLPPQEMLEVKSVARQIAETIVKTYGDVIPPERLERNKDIAERVVITDDVGVFAYEWEPEVRSSKTPLETVRGASFQEGGIITILDPRLAWEKLSPYSKEIYIEEEGDELSAKQQYMREFLGSLLVHELLHQYGNWDEEQEFLECGVGYYQEQLLRFLHIPYYPSEQREIRNEFYASLRNKYGEDVDRVFFGTATNPVEKSKIMVEVAEHKEEFFPEGRGL